LLAYCQMRAFYKTTIFVLIPPMLSIAVFLCCCERLAFADSCHPSTPSSQHCHPSTSQNREQKDQGPGWAASHSCDCEKIVTDRGSLRFSISISSLIQPWQKSFVLVLSIPPVLASFASSPIHGPPDLKSSAVSLYLQFSNLRI